MAPHLQMSTLPHTPCFRAHTRSCLSYSNLLIYLPCGQVPHAGITCSKKPPAPTPAPATTGVRKSAHHQPGYAALERLGSCLNRSKTACLPACHLPPAFSCEPALPPQAHHSTLLEPEQCCVMTHATRLRPCLLLTALPPCNDYVAHRTRQLHRTTDSAVNTTDQHKALLGVCVPHAAAIATISQTNNAPGARTCNSD